MLWRRLEAARPLAIGGDPTTGLRYKNRVKLYDFDGIGPELDLLPLAARRALDQVGKKLGRDGFRSLPHALRVALVEAGEAETVDQNLVLEIVSQAQPQASNLTPLADPDSAEVPPEVTAALGAERPLPLKVWQSLPCLGRYSLLKVCEKNRPERVLAAYREIVGATAQSTHLSPGGEARMVRISEKPVTKRVAIAQSRIDLGQDAFAQILSGGSKKGDVLAVARIAGIMATKKTSELIPLCHPIALTHAEVRFQPDASEFVLYIECQAECVGPTGVEMEALVGASAAALTVYDMLKSTNRSMTIGPTQLLSKTGGSSGTFPPSPSPSPKTPKAPSP